MRTISISISWRACIVCPFNLDSEVAGVKNPCSDATVDTGSKTRTFFRLRRCVPCVVIVRWTQNRPSFRSKRCHPSRDSSIRSRLYSVHFSDARVRILLKINLNKYFKRNSYRKRPRWNTWRLLNIYEDKFLNLSSHYFYTSWIMLISRFSSRNSSCEYFSPLNRRVIHINFYILQYRLYNVTFFFELKNYILNQLFRIVFMNIFWIYHVTLYISAH